MKRFIQKWGWTSIILGGTCGTYLGYVFLLAAINTFCDCI